MIADVGVGPAAQPLDLACRDRIEGLLAAHPSPLSESSFANLYLFRLAHDYAFIDGQHPCIVGRTYDGERHALPLCPLTGGGATTMLALADCLYPIGEDGPQLAGSLGLACDWRDADSDYVYDAERLGALRGAKVKRAQARHFEAQGPMAETFQTSSAPSARAVLAGWLADVGRSADATDYDACADALATWERLGLQGVLVRLADGEPVAFLLASRSSDGGHVVHFAKGRRTHPGAYPWMFARFAEGLGSGRINFEQDLGNPGFAQSKRAFAPVTRLRKHRLRRPV